MNIFKALIPIAFLFFLAGCSDASDSTSKEENNEDSVLHEEALPQVEVVFPEMFRHFTMADSSFSSESFEGGQTDIRTDSADQQITNETIARYLPFLIFNPDSTYAIDLVTRNYVHDQRNDRTILAEGEPDFEVGLIDLRNNKRKQLLFFGTMGTVLDAGWHDNSTVMIAGANEVLADSIRPVIWKYEIPSKAWYVYTYDKLVPINADAYPKKWLAQEGGN